MNQTGALTRLYIELRKETPNPNNIKSLFWNLDNTELETFCHYIAGYFLILQLLNKKLSINLTEIFWNYLQLKH